MIIEVYYNFKKKENEVIPMENKLVLLSLRDRENPDVEKMFVQLKENNSVLYRFLISTLQKDPLLGVRQDVFTYIAANATEFNQNQRYMFNLSRIMCNIKISPEHIKWIDSYLRKKGEYETVDDFFIIFDEAVEKDMSLEQIQSFFETESDEVILYDKIMNYESETNDTVAETTQLETESESQVEPEHEIEIEKKENYQSKNSNVSSAVLKECIDKAVKRSQVKDLFVSTEISDRLLRRFETKEGKPLYAISVPIYEDNEEKATFYEIVVPGERVSINSETNRARLTLFKNGPDGQVYTHIAKRSFDNGNGGYDTVSKKYSSEEVINLFDESKKKYRENHSDADHSLEDEEAENAIENQVIENMEQSVNHRHSRR